MNDDQLPSFDRFDEFARNLYADLRLSGRTPVAVVGSGLSVPYGGVSWGEAVAFALNEAARQLKEADTLPLSARDKSRRMRALGSVAVLIDSGYPTAQDKYLALDVAKDAIGFARSCFIAAKEQPGPDFVNFMKRLFVSDAYSLAATLADRFCLAEEAKNQLLGLAEIDPDQVQALACHIYSLSSIRRLAEGDIHLVSLADRLEEELKGIFGAAAQDVLPVDRRSLLCVFLRGCDEVVLRGLYDQFVRTLPTKNDPARAALRAPPRPLIDPIRALYDDLGIRRFITLNFDLELENAIMIDDLRVTKGRAFGFQDAIDTGALTREAAAGRQPAGHVAPDTYGVTRRFSDGLAASSDVYAGAAVSRLFEFALNSPDYRAQILHLHGRADLPATMLLTEGDLNRIYRRNPRSRTTLEQALDVVLTGNSVLFAGIGLSEPEIPRALRMLVSEGRATPTNPAFALMAYDEGTFPDDGTDLQGGSDAWRHQMSLFRQYGIHLIDAGHARHGATGGLPRQLCRLDRIAAALETLKRNQEGSRAEPVVAAIDSLAAELAQDETLSIADGISLDGAASRELFSHLRRNAAGITPGEAGLALDYVTKLSSKLRSYCTEREIKRLANHLAGRFNQTSVRALDLPDGSAPERRDRQEQAVSLVREAAMPLANLPGSVSVRHDVKLNRCLPSCDILDRAGMLTSAPAGVHCFLAPLGWGKGELAHCLKVGLEADPATPYVLINCNFAFEFESAILQILRFVWFSTRLKPLEHPVRDRMAKLATALEVGPEKGGNVPPTIVLTGIERLVDSTGEPLTPEFEVMLRLLIKHATKASNWRVIVIGTPQCKTLLKRCGTKVARDNVVRAVEKPWPDRPGSLVGFIWTALDKAAEKTARGSALRNQVMAATLASRQAVVPNGARSDASSVVLRIALENWHDIVFTGARSLHDARTDAEFDKAVLQSLAFIGQPVEIAVLRHLPTIIDAAHVAEPRKVAWKVARSCRRLAQFGLVLRIRSFTGGGTSSGGNRTRVTLHRSVLAEIRERFGVRSGNEMLSNSFALTLAVSMPTDLVIADTDIHQLLKTAVGHLRGAWKDAILEESVVGAFTALRKAAGLSEAGSALLADNSLANAHIAQLERLACFAVQPMQPRLRAAAGIVRGFFTAATLVAMIPDGVERDEWDYGEFADHKRRIAGLIARVREAHVITVNAAEAIAFLKVSCPKVISSIAEIERLVSKPRDGHGALYSGELVWLLNELGVIALLQGDLYTADQSFREADATLKFYKGYGAGQSWRRLEINRALVRIERGGINQARLKLEAIAPEVSRWSPGAKWEDKVTAPLVAGYLGLCDFLGGHYESAETKYDSAIAPLLDTGQQRAAALFYWRKGELLLTLHRWQEAEEALRLGLAAAEAGRQIDVSWRARLSLLKLPGADNPQAAEAVLREAQSYANVMDMPRIAVMSFSRRAHLRLGLGDLQSAASFATQAMQVATSNGMVLNRISARTLMGRILLRQGDPSGEHLLRRAIAHADRIGFQLHVDRAQEALLELEHSFRA